MSAETKDLPQVRPDDRPNPWNDPRIRALIYQLIVFGIVIGVAWYLVANTLNNLEQQDIATGFGFLEREASFDIAQTLIEYDATNSYARAFVVGILNTAYVSVFGIIACTFLGTFVGVARLSKNWLMAKLAEVFTEIMRNVPLLLVLFFCYAIITQGLPRVRQALELGPGMFLSNRGFVFPVPEAHWAFDAALIAILVAIGGAIIMNRWAKRRQDLTGEPFPSFWAGTGLIIGLPFLVWVVGGAPTAMSVPEMAGFNFRGGAGVSPEFLAMFIGLTIYHAAFMAEIVRGGILAVSTGQTEAAYSLGLRRSHVLMKVVLPQALRVIVPPTTSLYLSLVKNSSLGVAIGYPDLVSIGNTTMNQTGQAIEAVTIFISVYLFLSLSISLFMNWYNKHIALVER